MTKNELIKQLNEISGNPEVFIKTQGGNTLVIDEVEPAYCEINSQDVFTSSYSHEGIETPCIVLWTEQQHMITRRKAKNQ